MRGTPGTDVHVTFLRGTEEMAYTLTRANINVNRIDSMMLTDEDGTEYLYDIAARMEHGDNEYVVLVPQDENDDEVVILRSEIVDDETEEFVPEEDDSITDAIFEEFKQMFADDYNFADGDEGDDSMFTDAE